jgi:hypothetical protein
MLKTAYHHLPLRDLQDQGTMQCLFVTQTLMFIIANGISMLLVEAGLT